MEKKNIHFHNAKFERLIKCTLIFLSIKYHTHKDFLDIKMLNEQKKNENGME